MATGTDKHRLLWIDYSKGVGIILVVFGHVLIGITAAGFAGRPFLFDTTIYFIYSFHMPLFFVLAGYVFRVPKERTFAHFLVQSVIGLLVPYLIWNLVFALLKNISPSTTNVPVTLADIPSVILHPVQHFWFLPVLFFVRLIYWVFERFGAQRGRQAIAIVSIAFYVAGSVVGFRTLLDARLMGFIDVRFFMGMAFFGIGCLVAERAALLTRLGTPAMLAAATVIWLAVTAIGYTAGIEALEPLMALTGVAATLALCLLLPAARALWARLLAFAGEASLGIYVCHGVFAAAMRTVLLKLHVTDVAVHVLLATPVGLFGPAVIVILANRLGISPYVGLGRNWSSRYLSLGGLSRDRSSSLAQRPASGSTIEG